MKQTVLLFVFWVGGIWPLPFAMGQSVKWPIDSVSVYENGANIERIGAVELDEKGEATITLAGLSSSAIDEMLQVSLYPGWSLTSHVFKTEIPEDQLELAADNQAAIDEEIQLNRQTFLLREALLFAYEEELEMIRANRKVNGEELLLVDDLRDHANFWRERLKELSYLMLELRMEMETITATLEELQSKRQYWDKNNLPVEGQWILRFSGPPNSRNDVRISYMVPDAGWSAVYEVEVSPAGNIKMKLYASAFQSTGLDWEGVPLVFVVGDLMQSISPPVFEKKELNLAGGDAVTFSAQDAGTVIDEKTGRENPRHERMLVANAAGRSVFCPANLSKIYGDGSHERIFINEFDLTGDLSYLIFPEYACEAFQFVNTEEWTDSELVSGQVQVVASGTYQSDYYMQLPKPGETLRIPLGQDFRVRANRKRVLDHCTSKVFRGARVTSETFEITIENQHNQNVSIVVKDALPVSANSDILVEVIELGGAEFDATSGQLEWHLDLGPNEGRTLSFEYVITHPKRRLLLGL
tara:strand:+ start:184 stop:1761 length:1578 start_codon:yes stop_codon:yes gene_type:complete